MTAAVHLFTVPGLQVSVHNRVSWHLGVLLLGGCGYAARCDGSGEGNDVVVGLGGGSWVSLVGVVGQCGWFCK